MQTSITLSTDKSGRFVDVTVAEEEEVYGAHGAIVLAIAGRPGEEEWASLTPTEARAISFALADAAAEAEEEK